MVVRSTEIRCYRTHQSSFDKSSLAHSCHNLLLFNIGGVVPLIEVKTTNIINFIKCHIIHWFGIPRRIIHDTVPNLQASHSIDFATSIEFKMWLQLCTNLAANRLAEDFNKMIIKLLKNIISARKWDWNEKLGECFWAYRTTVWTPIGNVPFSLVYGVKQSYL